MEEERITELLSVPEWKSILLDLVKKNELDPWNIDIIKLTSLYLDEIRRRKDLDLYIPANAVLASSILLWLKSSILKSAKEELEEKEEEPEMIEPLPEPEPEPLIVEEAPVEGVIVPPERIVKREISLDELLDAMEKLMKKGVRMKKFEPLPEVEDFFEAMETDEDVEDYVEEVYERAKRMKDSTDSVLFSSLAGKDPLNMVKTLLALLHLATEGKVELYQEEVFGEIVVRVIG
jgi:segregation and condensation protein A